MRGLDASAVLQGLLSHTRRPLNCVLSLITEILINMEFVTKLSYSRWLFFFFIIRR